MSTPMTEEEFERYANELVLGLEFGASDNDALRMVSFREWPDAATIERLWTRVDEIFGRTSPNDAKQK